MKISRILSVAALFLCTLAAAQAPLYTEDEVRAMLREDHWRAANFHHAYEIPKIADTKAPRGFKPFYISHYGRHGERYHIGYHNYNRVLDVLAPLDSAGKLTPTGQEILAGIRKMNAEQQGMEGILTQKGAQTHRGIASRMYARYRRVFRQKGRDSVLCAATKVPRVIQSMDNFVLSLSGKAGRLKFSTYTGDRYSDYLCRHQSEHPGRETVRAWCDSVFKTDFPSAGVLERLIADPETAQEVLLRTPSIVYRILYCGAIAGCFDTPQFDVFNYFTEEEIYLWWRICNVDDFNDCANSAENGGHRPAAVGGPILRDIIDKADAALAGGNHCADLRFGHDSGIMPLVALLNLDGMGEAVPSARSAERFLVFKEIPMGSNLQVVFYRNRKGEVLAKFLLNETERTIPALAGVARNGVYYPWTELRAYLEGLI